MWRWPLPTSSTSNPSLPWVIRDRVGDLAARIARRMLGESEAETVRLAGLTHDLGLVAVPSFVLHKSQEELSAAEWERLRLHPYHAERILGRIPAFRAVIPLVGAHHERVDGQGYYRGLAGSQIPPGARILAVADRYDELTHGLPGHPPLDSRSGAGVGCMSMPGRHTPRSASDHLRRSCAPTGPPREAHADHASASGLAALPAARSSSSACWPADSAGERWPRKLFLSEHTVRHHLEHIYDKIGVRTRVAATLFAVEHDLLN